MTSIQRTAYPRFHKKLSEIELLACFTLTDDEVSFINKQSRNDQTRLTISAMLKTRQYLGYFIGPDKVPLEITHNITQQLSLSESLIIEPMDKKTLFRMKQVCRTFLKCKPFKKPIREKLISFIHKSAHTMSDPADLVNVAIEFLAQSSVELPAYSTLVRLARHERKVVHEKLFNTVHKKLSHKQASKLDQMLTIKDGQSITMYSQLKQPPGPATLSNFRLWANRMVELDKLIDTDQLITELTYTKIRQFGAQAESSSISDLRNISNKPKMYTLLVCFLHQKHAQIRDELINMTLKQMRRVKSSSTEKLISIQDEHKAIEEGLLGVLNQILDKAKEPLSNLTLGDEVFEILKAEGGVKSLSDQLVKVRAFHKNNYFPFLWPIHATNRAVIFKVITTLNLKASTQDKRLMNALDYLIEHQTTRKTTISAKVDLSFVSARWQKFVLAKNNQFNRQAFELCVLFHLVDAIECGDIYVIGSHEYSDYRKQLLSADECQKILAEYCESIGVSANPETFVNELRQQMIDLGTLVDKSFPENTDLSIDSSGKPHLKRQLAKGTPAKVKEFKKMIYSKMPERHMIDIIKNVQHWASYFKHFGPPSHNQSKLRQATKLYIFTVFGYGSNLRSSQTAKHAPDLVNRQVLRRVNAHHINVEKLDKAIGDIDEIYRLFELPSLWGSANVAIADGTLMKLRLNNLLGEQHFRYKNYGGIAYHHICGDYIALFSHFIPCGVWEAVYILDALWEHGSNRKVDTLHADTHGQSEPVFGLAHLLGINLYPRMRNWNDVTFYRPDRNMKYKHIDSLFTQSIDWQIIQIHWKDMMQVVLSIHKGKVLPSMLLRRLNSKNKHNKLYLAFRELGRVIRTLFLLRYISEADFRFSIRAETTKVESYNDFLDWISFGGEVLKSGDPVEQTKQIKYMDLIANSIMLQNVVDLSNVIETVANDEVVTKDMLSVLSPYIRDHIRRFGQIDVDEHIEPPKLTPKPLPMSS